jgi:hypothetical protein
MKIFTKKAVCPGAAKWQPVMAVFKLIKTDGTSENGRKRIGIF